jgi:hypothetical protein
MTEPSVDEKLYGDPRSGEFGIISQQLFDARIKAHEIIEEHLKQVITIASGTLALTVSFLKDIVGNSGGKSVWPGLLPFCWIALAISIMAAVVCIATLVNNLDAPDLERSNRDPTKPWIKAFGAASKQYIVNIEWIALLSFMVGMLSLAVFASRNYQLFLSRTADEAEARHQLAKQSNHFAIVPDPDHLGSDGKKHSHTFLIDQNTGTVWDLYCRQDKSVDFRRVPIDGISNPIMSAQPK